MNNYGVLSDLHLISSSLFFSWTMNYRLVLQLATVRLRVSLHLPARRQQQLQGLTLTKVD